MNKINTKVNDFGNKLLAAIRGDSSKSARSKIKASIFAIVIGLIVGIIPMLISGGSVLESYIDLFVKPFSEFSLDNTVIYIAIFSLLGAGIGVSFKTGLFNIGAAGQMLLAGAVTTMMGIKMDLPKAASIPLMIFLSIIIGSLTSAFAGVLKAKFNVHEVVSTILLNWIIFYFVKYLFMMEAFKGTSSGASQIINDSMKFDIKDSWLILAISIVFVAGLWFMFKYTTFGFKLTVNGMNQDAAQYAGINKSAMTITSMAVSGGFIGLAGFIYYSTLQGQMPDLDNSLPTIGFEAITVTLLAFSSPLGSIFAGAFYGIISVGAGSAAIAGGVTIETMNLVIGFIIFAAALAPVLVKTNFKVLIRDEYLFRRNPKLLEMKSKLKKQLVDIAKWNKDDIAKANEFVSTNSKKIESLENAFKLRNEKISEQFKSKKISRIELHQKLKESETKFVNEMSDKGFDIVSKTQDEYKVNKDNLKQKFKLKKEIQIKTYLSKKEEAEDKKQLASEWKEGVLW